MARLVFLVQGSAPQPYTVTFSKEGSRLTANCTCPAATAGQSCKHRLAILSGATDGIVGDNQADVATVQAWLPGTDLAEAIQDLAIAETQLEQAKQHVARMKKKLARLLHQ